MYQEAQKINKTFFFNEELYNRLGIAAIDYELSVDIKLMLNLLGKQSTSSRYSFCLDCNPWLDPNSPTFIKNRYSLGELPCLRSSRCSEEKESIEDQNWCKPKLFHNVVKKTTALMHGEPDQNTLPGTPSIHGDCQQDCEGVPAEGASFIGLI